MPPKILLVSPLDRAGGGERIAWMLHEAYRQQGYDSWLAVGQKRTADAQVLPLRIPHRWENIFTGAADWLARRFNQVRGSYRLQTILRSLAHPHIGRTARWLLGHEIFEYPETYHLLDLPPQRPDILHLHNLHGSYFDLRALPWLSQQLPTCITLHDAWLLSGHCAHSLDCDRWLTGCGHCPDLTLYPALRRDGTAYNWRRKQALYQQSRLHVVTPSQWLMDKVQRSMLVPAIQSATVIPNGMNLHRFRPGEQAAVRAALNLPQEAILLLFSAAGIRKNIWKDYATMQAAVAAVGAQSGRPVIFIGLGENAPPEVLNSARIQFVPFTAEPDQVVQYYQAADIYVHAARADTFPNSVLEALACGLPVVATAVGGIPEQVRPLETQSLETATGLLTPPGDSPAMAAAILRLIEAEDLRRTLGRNARLDAEVRFDETRMVDRYLALYERMAGT